MSSPACPLAAGAVCGDQACFSEATTVPEDTCLELDPKCEPWSRGISHLETSSCCKHNKKTCCNSPLRVSTDATVSARGGANSKSDEITSISSDGMVNSISTLASSHGRSTMSPSGVAMIQSLCSDLRARPKNTYSKPDRRRSGRPHATPAERATLRAITVRDQATEQAALSAKHVGHTK